MPLIWILAVLSMTIGNLGALTQRNVKRMLAYSSIAHAGYLLVAFTALAPMGIASASFYTAAYAAMNVGAFGIISYLSGYNEARTNLSDYAGAARRHPVACAAFAVFLISLIGIPFTAGFFGKFYVFTAAVNSGNAWLAVLGLLNSGVAAFYYLRLLGQMYMVPESSAWRPRAGYGPCSAIVRTGNGDPGAGGLRSWKSFPAARCDWPVPVLNIFCEHTSSCIVSWHSKVKTLVCKPMIRCVNAGSISAFKVVNALLRGYFRNLEFPVAIMENLCTLHQL